MSVSRSIYKVFRSLLFTAVLVVIGLFASVYILISIPSVQNKIRSTAEKELSVFFGSKVEIGELKFFPFNELRLYQVSFFTPAGQRCISIGRVGAGISLWSLISEQKIEISYAEIISLDARIVKSSEEAPYNIDFIINAFAPKDNNKPPTKFDIILRNVVIRKSQVSFDRSYVPANKNKNVIDFNHLCLKDLKADVALPILKNDEISVDLRRLAFNEKCGLLVNSLSLNARYTPNSLSFSDFRLGLADTDISVSDQSLTWTDKDDFKKSVFNSNFDLHFQASPLVLSDFACFYPDLLNFNTPSALDIHAEGKINDFILDNFYFEDYRNGSELFLSGDFSHISDLKLLKATRIVGKITAAKPFVQKVVGLIPGVSNSLKDKLELLGPLSVDTSGQLDMGRGKAELKSIFATECGNMNLNATLSGLDSKKYDISFDCQADKINLHNFVNIHSLGLFALDANGNINIHGNNIDGVIQTSIPYLFWNETRFVDIIANLEKSGSEIKANLTSPNPMCNVDADVDFILEDKNSSYIASALIKNIQPAILGIKSFNIDDKISGNINVNAGGKNIDDITGFVDVSDLTIKSKNKKIHVDQLKINSEIDNGMRLISLNSDFINGIISGNLLPSSVIASIKRLLANILPSFFPSLSSPNKNQISDSYLNYQLTVYPSDNFFNFIKAPVRPGVPVNIDGGFSQGGDSISFNLNAPYLVQGKNKLLKNSSVSLSASSRGASRLLVSTDMPVKNDRAVLDAQISAWKDKVDFTLDWEGVDIKSNKGQLSLSAGLHKSFPQGKFLADIDIDPSSFSLHGADWLISPAHIDYGEKRLLVEGLKVAHDKQFVDIGGCASDSPLDELNVDLAGIDLDYIFGILNIDHVNFGGIATGRAKVSSLFSKNPRAFTDGLFVKDLAYNDCVLGDGNLESHWDNSQKMVAINADIIGKDKSSATVRGGVYVTRDSLAFDFGAERVNIEFLQPFMSGFTSSVQGHASGNVSLYGTFSDIDLGGAVFADDITMLVDHTNVRYSASDSLFFSPGKITIPGLTLHDRFGNSCRFEGEVTHNFLKDASFSFRLSDARNLLVFDTDKKDNPTWYGTIFANGSASLRGLPGLVALSVDMSTSHNSEFTFVLDETEEAAEYTFLTFSDRRKEEMAKLEVEESFEDKFYKNSINQAEESPTAFMMDLALDVTPEAKMIIVMDPKAGDKITANGSGALQMRYNTGSDEFNIYGKYTLLNGWYNFSLQDLILKNFKIENGSNISFNGDPMRGILDITAAYRVNTNLKDLANSFESDPDLNRTYVPVDALLKVTGDIHSPEIKFDIALPTVTSEVERKVRSIISTEDMLNRQVIYLLALNRFYSPEYVGAEQGGEIASVASSTLSSQIQNIIGSLTDRFTLAPSFKSEKNDLSDMEVDLALSSSFFDNRLLLNGNLGYRDKSTSQTTFIGDFDLEYLLSKDGKLRLKAYNHFNDASYYLRSALTTQGIGIIYRKDFDDPLKFIKLLMRRFRKPEEENGKSSENNNSEKKDKNSSNNVMNTGDD